MRAASTAVTARPAARALGARRAAVLGLLASGALASSGLGGCAPPCPPGTEAQGDYCARVDGPGFDGSVPGLDGGDAGGCDCPAERPICEAGRCLECNDANPCAGAATCVAGTCALCVEDADCPDATPRCAEGGCESCLGAASACPPELQAREVLAGLCEARIRAAPDVPAQYEAADLASYCHPAGVRNRRIRELVEAGVATARLPSDECDAADPACWLGGEVAGGASCHTDLACGDECVPTDGSRCGVCTQVVGAGQPCTRTRVCMEGLACNGGTCGAAIPAGMGCVSNENCAPGVCYPFEDTCGPRGSVGAPGCDEDADCVEGLVCGPAMACAALPGVGEACHEGALCDAGLRCDLSECREPRATGALCARSSECGLDARCNSENVCAEMLAPGAACGGAGQVCVWGFACSDGRCTPLPDVGEPCLDGACFRGTCSAGTCEDLAVGALCSAGDYTARGAGSFDTDGYDALDPCGEASSCVDGQCVRDALAGEACTPRCAPPLACGTDGVCAMLPEGCR